MAVIMVKLKFIEWRVVIPETDIHSIAQQIKSGDL